jgi:Tfp pilus assembly protein PilV
MSEIWQHGNLSTWGKFLIVMALLTGLAGCQGNSARQEGASGEMNEIAQVTNAFITLQTMLRQAHPNGQASKQLYQEKIEAFIRKVDQTKNTTFHKDIDEAFESFEEEASLKGEMICKSITNALSTYSGKSFMLDSLVPKDER